MARPEPSLRPDSRSEPHSTDKRCQPSSEAGMEVFSAGKSLTQLGIPARGWSDWKAEAGAGGRVESSKYSSDFRSRLAFSVRGSLHDPWRVAMRPV